MSQYVMKMETPQAPDWEEGEMAQAVGRDLLTSLAPSLKSKLGNETVGGATAGAAFTTASVPMLPPAPARFSTTKDCPSRSASH